MIPLHPPFVTIEYAANEILKCPVERVRYYLEQGILLALVPTPGEFYYPDIRDSVIDAGLVKAVEPIYNKCLLVPRHWDGDKVLGKIALFTTSGSPITRGHMITGTELGDLDSRFVAHRLAMGHSFSVNDIRIPIKDIQNLLSALEKQEKGSVPSETPISEQANDSESPEEYSVRRRKEMSGKFKPNHLRDIIAGELKYECSYNLRGHEIARLADPQKTYTEDQEKKGNPRKNGDAWAKAGKKIINNLKNDAS
ncbi:hypothetical protein OR1_03566 [Geobacter sp. OR-1]|uniref:hypothetical protein n=1 Tax=Geobacter sp. OR-1 TaxID=1266765 RepID=UPI0005424B8B|nr:hypothetical protein [Geobacter sp. OR-1]GAM11255.1 hypothetical protein OR1_03566 [Geobacter sp. OR-1]